LMWCPRLTFKRCETRSTKPTAKQRRALTSKARRENRVFRQGTDTQRHHRRPTSSALSVAGGETGQAFGLAKDSRRRQDRSSQPQQRSPEGVVEGRDHSGSRKQINKLVKDMGAKSLSSSIQGDQVRVTGKQRDDLQRAMTVFKEATSRSPCSSRTSATNSRFLFDP